MSHWAAAPIDRQQVVLFAPTLDGAVPPDHPVRVFDEILRGLDFAAWESTYVLTVGQPPIHPRVLAGAILYGLSLGIRSSRKLEDAAGNRLDFIWLLDGRRPDHATICAFRTKFAGPLKDLFRRVGRVAIDAGMATLNQVTLDGTAVAANNSRFNTNRRATLEQKLAALDEQVDKLMKEAAEQDGREDGLYGKEGSPSKLPRALRDMKRRQEALRRAMRRVEELEADREGRKDVSSKGPAVPLADPDARVLPNKGGGFAPNYTPVLAVDAASGIILDVQVLGGNDEAGTVLPAVDAIEGRFGRKPAQVAADSGFNSGPNLAGLAERGIEPLMPARQPFGENPAERADPSVPVAEADHAKLPVNPQNKVLDKAAFVYDPAGDVYRCPQGRTLGHVEDKPYNRDGVKGTYRVYECGSCAGCPLAGRCLPGKSPARRVCRDEHEPLRERMAARMKSEDGTRQYKRRSHAAETPFAFLKARMGFRQFLLRGLDKVRTEMNWAATAYNLAKLTRRRIERALHPAPATP